MTARVRLFGRPQIEDVEQPSPLPRAAKSWALLARIALAERPLTRHELASELYSEADDPLGSLRWGLADVRRSLAMPDALRGDPLCFAPDELRVDVLELEQGQLPIEQLGGELLEGVEPRECPVFDSWLLMARSRWATRTQEELRSATLDHLSRNELDSAVDVAHRASALDPLNQDAHELFLRALVMAGREGQASVHLASCLALFAREGLEATPSLRAAARSGSSLTGRGRRVTAAASTLIRSGTAALGAGAPDSGIATLRRAVLEADRANDHALQVDALHALGAALVHAVRGYDGEGAVVLNRALGLARSQGRPEVLGDIWRELAFVDVQSGRHASAARALELALEQARICSSDSLRAGVLALQGMNVADRGRHAAAVELLSDAARTARSAGQPRQESWAVGVMARSLLLLGRIEDALRACDSSIELARKERWNAFLPWPQVIRAQILTSAGQVDSARAEAEDAFDLACELGDPCWEGMAARALGLLESGSGNSGEARDWMREARLRSDRVADRYVWVSAYIGLAEAQMCQIEGRGAIEAATNLYNEALANDLPEMLAWALVLQAEAGDASRVEMARSAAIGIENPALQRRVRALRPDLDEKGAPLDGTTVRI